MNRWITEYLLSIRETSRLLHGPEGQTIAVGDVFVLKNDSPLEPCGNGQESTSLS